MSSPSPRSPRPKHISVHQSADLLGIDTHMLLRLIAEGYLSTIDQLDGTIAVDLDDVLWMRPVVSVARDCSEIGISVNEDDVEDIRYQQQLSKVEGMWYRDRQ